MAQSMNLRPFYVALGVVAAAGGAWIFSARVGSGTVTVTLPAAVGAEAFAGYVMGSDSAMVEIVEYADFQCPACASFEILTAPDVKSRLVNTGRVRWRFKDFPLPAHDKSPLAHLAAACAGEQGRFWAMHDQLFYNQGTWARGRKAARLFEGYARAIGLDMKQYDQCMDEQRYVERIAATKNEAAAAGINSTPSFVVGDQLIAGAVSFKRLMELVERAEAAARQ